MGQLLIRFVDRKNLDSRQFELKLPLSRKEEEEFIVKEVVVNGQVFIKK
jgi:hypothetical protein